jgi:anion-transporting  ArsA/GET3 family ATPase
MSDFDRKLVFVTGKGGVGKSTVASALGVALSRRGHRVLLAFTEAGQAAELLGARELDSEIREVKPNLFGVVLEPRAALRQYAELALPNAMMVRALIDNRYSRSFLAAIPGLYPWALLGKAWYHTTETEDGRARFDNVILDAPATGHGLEMLRVPQVISAATAPGILKRDAERAVQMLKDPAQTALVVVTLPEPLPIVESRELIEALQAQGLPAPRLVVNSRAAQLFSDEQRAQLDELTRRPLSAEARTVLSWAAARARAEQTQAEASAQLTAGPAALPVTTLPWVPDADRPAGVLRLAEELQHAL